MHSVRRVVVSVAPQMWLLPGSHPPARVPPQKVIFSTVLYFGNSVKPLNWFGSLLVFTGVVLYSASKVL